MNRGPRIASRYPRSQIKKMRYRHRFHSSLYALIGSPVQLLAAQKIYELMERPPWICEGDVPKYLFNARWAVRTVNGDVTGV